MAFSNPSPIVQSCPNAKKRFIVESVTRFIKHYVQQPGKGGGNDPATGWRENERSSRGKVVEMTLPPDGGKMNAEEVRALRCALVSSGFAILPEITGLKFPPKPHSQWRQRTTPFDPAIDYANQYGLLLNTALILDGLVAIDLDIDSDEDVTLAMDIMHEHLGYPVCVRTRANSPRRAALYRTDDPTGLSAALTGSDGAIEVFSGRLTKLSAFGWHTHKQTRQQVRMTWDQTPGNVSAADLTIVTLDQITHYLDAVAEVLGEDSVCRRHVPGSAPPSAAEDLRASDLAELYRAASVVPNDGPCDWHRWNKWAMALYGASGGDDVGLLAFAEWTLKNPQSQHRDWLGRWHAIAQCPPTRIGAGSVFQAAYKAGYRRSAVDKRKYEQQKAEEKRLANFTFIV